MLVSQFSFDLPKELIATSPATPRSSAKMLLLGEEVGDVSVSDIVSFLRPGDVMVLNDTKVIAARLFGVVERQIDGSPSEAKAQVTLHKQESPSIWKAFGSCARK